jgi:uncharacterized RDD family membrane protein YckC
MPPFTLSRETLIFPAMNATLFCNKCGTANEAAAQFCCRCGAAFSPAAASPGQVPPATAPPVAGYSAPYPTAQFVRYGGFWIRVVATIIDAIIVRVFLFPVKAMFGLGTLAIGGFDPDNLRHGLALPYLIFGGGVVALLTVVASWLYEALMESSSYQATLGKMIFGMKVTDLYGNRIDFARATGRHFGKWLSGLALCIGFIMVGFTERKQGLHDMLAGTLVKKS